MARRTRTVEIDEEVFSRKETVAVRLAPDQAPFSIWHCPTSPGEKIRLNDSTILRFRNGTLECRDATDDAVVESANKHAGGRYLRADPALVEANAPFTYTESKSRRTTRWYSQPAFERYVALHPNAD